MGGTKMDYEKIKEAAQNYQDDMTRFLRAIVKNPGESCDERKHIETIEAEMKKLNFDEVTIDPQGNVIGYMVMVTKSLHSMHTLIPLVSATSKTGILIHTKDMKQMKKSAVVVYLISAVVSYLPYMVRRS